MNTGCRNLLILTCCLASLISCETPTIGNGEEADRQLLAEIREEILAAVEDRACTDTKECAHVGLGAKPCGGPWENVVYSISGVDEEALREAVRKFNLLNDIANSYYGWTSDCTVLPEPRLECLDNICTDTWVDP